MFFHVVLITVLKNTLKTALLQTTDLWQVQTLGGPTSLFFILPTWVTSTLEKTAQTRASKGRRIVIPWRINCCMSHTCYEHGLNIRAVPMKEIYFPYPNEMFYFGFNVSSTAVVTLLNLKVSPMFIIDSSEFLSVYIGSVGTFPW